MSKRKLKKKYKNYFVYIILLSLIFIFVCSTYKFISIIYFRNKSQELNKKLAKEVVEVDKKTKEISINIKKLKRINHDVVGWIRIPKTHINYAILKSKDNSYYLNHDIYKKYNINGSIFMNYANRYDFSDFNTILFGHYTRSLDMFSDLKKIYDKKIKFNKKNKIYIYTKDKKYEYIPYSMYLADANDAKPLNIGKSFFRKTEKDFDIDIKKKKVRQTLTLSTCYDNNSKRVILHAYLKTEK